MKYWFPALVLLLGGTAAQAATIKPTLMWCDGCTAPQKRSMAGTRPIGETVYIGDNTANSFSAYFVDLLLDDSYNPPRQVKSPHLTTLDPSYNDLDDALLDFYDHAPVGWHKSLQATYPVTPINVYDVVVVGPAQNNLLDWVSNDVGMIMNQIPIRIEQMLSFFTIADASKMPSIRVTVTFTDGSKIDVDVDYSTTNPDFKVVENSGRDSHNNVVLSRRTSAPTNFDFSGSGNPSDYLDWVHWMQQLGYGIPVSQGMTWACTQDPANGLHCVHIF
jgi:hypothetical protein